MNTFCDNYNLISLIKQPTCQKNPNNPICTDLILSNTPRSFQSTCVIETRLSDFQLKMKSFRKFHLWVINYRSYKNFWNEAFRECLIEKLSKEVYVNNDEGLQRFCDINLKVLNHHAPQKIKYVRGNQMPFMKKDFAIMFWEIEQKKIKFFITGKGITVYLFCENLREDTVET